MHLKLASVSDRLFHNVGAATEKAWSTNLVIVRGMCGPITTVIVVSSVISVLQKSALLQMAIIQPSGNAQNVKIRLYGVTLCSDVLCCINVDR